MPTAAQVSIPASISVSHSTETQKTSNRPETAYAEESNLGKISSFLKAIKNTVIKPALSNLNMGIHAVNELGQKHPFAMSILTSAFMIACAVFAVFGGPSAMLLGMAGFMAGAYFLYKNFVTSPTNRYRDAVAAAERARSMNEANTWNTENTEPPRRIRTEITTGKNGGFAPPKAGRD